MSPPGIWVLLPASKHYTTDPPFPSNANHYEQLCTPFCRCQSVGPSNESEVGFTQLLSSGEKFPGAKNHAGITEHSLSDGGMGECGEAQWDLAFLLVVPSLTVR